MRSLVRAACMEGPYAGRKDAVGQTESLHSVCMRTTFLHRPRRPTFHGTEIVNQKVGLGGTGSENGYFGLVLGSTLGDATNPNAANIFTRWKKAR